MAAMKRLFQLMAEKKASDIFLSVGSPINIKINGTAMPINQQVMDSANITNLLNEALSDKQKRIRGHARVEHRFSSSRSRQLSHQRFSPEVYAGGGGALHSHRRA
jgi:Tfp pilus assembly ATPase PilU